MKTQKIRKMQILLSFAEVGSEEVRRTNVRKRGKFSKCERQSSLRKDAKHFRDFFSISGPKGPRDLCKERADSQTSGKKQEICV